MMVNKLPQCKTGYQDTNRFGTWTYSSATKSLFFKRKLFLFTIFLKFFFIPTGFLTNGLPVNRFYIVLGKRMKIRFLFKQHLNVSCDVVNLIDIWVTLLYEWLLPVVLIKLPFTVRLYWGNVWKLDFWLNYFLNVSCTAIRPRKKYNRDKKLRAGGRLFYFF